MVVVYRIQSNSLSPAIPCYQGKDQGNFDFFQLSLLHSLGQMDEKSALTEINLHRFGPKSWNPELEVALMRIVTCRRVGFMDPKTSGEMAAGQYKSEHPFFDQLDQWARGELRFRCTSTSQPSSNHGDRVGTSKFEEWQMGIGTLVSTMIGS